MKFKLIIVVLFSGVALANNFEKEAKEYLMPFKKSLMGKLKGGMKKGAVHAVGMCNLEAPKITAKSNEGKFAIGRASNKFRNPKNAPQKWMKDVLSEYEKSNGKNMLPAKVIKLNNNEMAYVEPIYVKGLCLSCHGVSVAKPVQEILNNKYPNDKATGYKLGEFRGMFWVKSKNTTK